MGMKLTERDQKVLGLLQETVTEERKLTYEEIAQKVGVTRQRVGQIVQKLQRKGVIKHD